MPKKKKSGFTAVSDPCEASPLSPTNGNENEDLYHTVVVMKAHNFYVFYFFFRC